MNIVDRFIMSREYGWKLEDGELAEVITVLNDVVPPTNVYIVMDSTGTYLINKSYLRVKVTRKEDE